MNSRSVLLDRYRKCAARRGRVPNVIAVDFTEVGALQATVRELNSAIAKVTGVTFVIDQAVKNAFDSGELTEAEAREIRGLHRLPQVSLARARRTLGDAATYLTRPTSLDKLEADNCVTDVPATASPPGRRSRPATTCRTIRRSIAPGVPAAGRPRPTTTVPTPSTTRPAG